MRRLWALLLLALLLPACRDQDAHGTTERIRHRGVMRVGLSGDCSQRSYAELALLTRLAWRLGVEVTLYPAPIPDLVRALAAGTIDVVLYRPPRPDAPRATGATAGLGEAVTQLEAGVEGRRVLVLVRRGEDLFASLLRGYLAETAPIPPVPPGRGGRPGR